MPPVLMLTLFLRVGKATPDDQVPVPLKTNVLVPTTSPAVCVKLPPMFKVPDEIVTCVVAFIVILPVTDNVPERVYV